MNTYEWVDDDNVSEDLPDSSLHHHFIRLALIIALVGLPIIGGLTYWHDNVASALGIHRPVTMLEHSGSVLLNVSELKDHISLPMHGNHHRYWIGPIADSSYTTNCVTPGILKVAYFNTNQTLANQTYVDGALPFLRVTAYENQVAYDSVLRPVSTDSATRLTNSGGVALEIDRSTLTRMVIGPLPSQEIITLNYSSPQTILSMVRDSEKLNQL